MQTRRPRWLEKKKDFHFDKAANAVNGSWQEEVTFIEKITVERAAGFLQQLKQFYRECQLPYHRKIIFSPKSSVFSISGANFNILHLLLVVVLNQVNLK